MSSELSLIRGYSKFWEELFIIDSHDYIKVLNKCMLEKRYAPLDIKDIPQRRGLINEIAFSIFAGNCRDEDSIRVDELQLDDTFLKELFKEELKKSRVYFLGRQFTHEITINELNVIKELSRRLIHSFSNRDDLNVSPRFPGCGIVDNTRGDVYYRDTLVEVKAGDRAFGIQDVRQLLIYGALNSKQEKPLEIEYFELFNPRIGVVWQERVETIIDDLAGCSSFEFFNELIEFISCQYRSL